MDLPIIRSFHNSRQKRVRPVPVFLLEGFNREWTPINANKLSPIPANNADLEVHALPVGRLAVRLENPVGTHWRSFAFIRG